VPVMAPVKQLLKVGFSFRQADALTNLATYDLKKVIAHGFTIKQAKLLLAGGYTTTTLIRQGRFTRDQAELILQA
jgi:hypothetical protein